MRTLLFSAVIALAPAACSETPDREEPSSESRPEVKHEVKHELAEMSVDEVAAGLATKQLTVVDCNGDETRKKHGVIPGAILIEDEDTFPATALPSDKATKLVFYCGGPG